MKYHYQKYRYFDHLYNVLCILMLVSNTDNAYK